MGIQVALYHKTSYVYDRRVTLSPHVVRLRPAPHCRTAIISYSQKITPGNHFINWQQDPFGNYLARLVMPEKTSEFHVEVDLVADMTVINPFDFFLEPAAETFPFEYEPSLKKDLEPYLATPEPGPKLAEYLAGIDKGKKQIVDFLVDVNQALQKEIQYLVRMEPNVQSPEKTLTLRRGSCRDSALLLVRILRNLGLAARFASGYLIQLAADVKSLDGPSGPEDDFTDLHAWTEVYLPGAGWIGLDPTSGFLAGEGHIPLACSPEPQSAAPVTGALEKCEVNFTHHMKVTRIFESPRSTRPYPEEVWREIHDLGFKVDEKLDAMDVRLTMGGEPTFVSTDDMEGAESNTEAAGPAKRVLAEKLMKKLKKRWAPGGFRHSGEGKWYPGESPPRWVLGCFWRKDGKPIWQDDSLAADEERDYGFGAEHAKRFIESLAETLDIGTQCIRPAHEDSLCFPWKEQRLPDNAHPPDSGPKAPDERARLCVRHRDGRLHIFMPQTEEAEHYFELIEAVEATARKEQMPVVVGGCLPPHDSRINLMKITPDPGVIKVNIHPANNWRELAEITTGLYEEARLCGLGTEKFLMDGRHTGTGGGNHIVMGGATPADSPFLRRPDLLRSFVAYVNNHPSLSYLFSGLIIGPTSQGPRMDEARHDSLYELDIAFHELDRQMREHQQCPPWLVDRIFRNILVDVAGNPHRTEICIDKLYPPDSPSGRLGLVECQAFEMPPHARMSLAQQLLLRTLIAWFWKKPYREPLVRWGTRLNDRFMLPHFVETDFNDVIGDLNENGYSLKNAHFHPHFEFRFPAYGTVAYHDIQLELRQALEAWHVLGEEGGGGTVRYVDSSVERLQVKVRGLTDTRHVVTCNGRCLPLHPTGEPGAFVAGVRYRAWQPPACLHPTIPVHTPLVFDILDTWTKRAVGGCAYHVSHPGGRNNDTFPVNENEAQGRRSSRFIPMGHTPGDRQAIPPEERNPYFPFTLDLRMP